MVSKAICAHKHRAFLSHTVPVAASCLQLETATLPRHLEGWKSVLILPRNKTSWPHCNVRNIKVSTGLSILKLYLVCLYNAILS